MSKYKKNGRTLSFSHSKYDSTNYQAKKCIKTLETYKWLGDVVLNRKEYLLSVYNHYKEHGYISKEQYKFVKWIADIADSQANQIKKKGKQWKEMKNQK